MSLARIFSMLFAAGDFCMPAPSSPAPTRDRELCTLQPSGESRAESDSTEHAIAIAFSFIGTSGFAAGKAVRFVVYADVNGDRVADFTLTLATKQSLTGGDFIL